MCQCYVPFILRIVVSDQSQCPPWEAPIARSTPSVGLYYFSTILQNLSLSLILSVIPMRWRLQCRERVPPQKVGEMLTTGSKNFTFRFQAWSSRLYCQRGRRRGNVEPRRCRGCHSLDQSRQGRHCMRLLNGCKLMVATLEALGQGKTAR
jgi:hypothetical protein